nr:hypothetical protein [Clostridiales bacterium]
MRIYIQDLGGSDASAAARELRYFLSRFSPDTVAEDTASAGAVIRLETVEAEDRGYSVTRGTDDGGRPVVSVRGSDGAAVLYAVYRLLERGGMYFDIGGHGLKAGYSVIDTEKMLGDAGEKVVFDFRRRGIRQHINFPMDFSSWRLGEAKEYIRSIARAGYDHITFHSYSGMWHSADSAYGGGGFFYNQLYRLPHDEELRKLIDNEEIYCVPEFEPYADDRQARGRAANRWLNSLISVAHEHLMSVTLSIEPLGSDDPAAQINMARRVLEGYPDIDCLEIISAECGGSTPAFDASELAERLREYFGEAAVVPEKLPDRIDANIAGAMHSLRAAKQIYDALRDRELKGKSFSAGMYITTAEALNIIKPIMFRLFDESVTMSFLTSYGSYHVAKNLREMSFTADELRRTMIYAWLEFDGSMYMMQNGSEGMERVFRLVREVTGGKQAGCVAFNHWRTAENLLPGSYGAAAGAGFIPAKEYYAVYGGRYALGEGFAPLMAEIAEADLLLREKLFNIGFCYLGCYLNWGGDDPVSWLA